MQIKNLIAVLMVFVAAIGLDSNRAHAQLWRQFVHPNQRHLDAALRNPNVYLSTFDLMNNSADITITRPVLVILMDFSDVTHENAHTVAFYRDLFFGNPRPGGRASVAEMYRANTNGRMLLVPDTGGDTHGQQDGIVGWVATSKTFQQMFADIHAKRAEAIKLADPFKNIAAGISAVPEPPRTIRIAGGSYPEKLVLNTPVTLKGWRNGNVVIGK
jgi:hypothetical protein